MKPFRTIAKLKSGAETTVVALGDSLTQGWMVRRGFLDFLAEMLRKAYPESRFRIVNRGIPGDTAEGGLHRLRADVLDHNPDCVLIQFALNDAFCGYGVEQFGQYVQWMVDQIREDGDAEIVLVTSSYVGNNRETRLWRISTASSKTSRGQRSAVSPRPLLLEKADRRGRRIPNTGPGRPRPSHDGGIQAHGRGRHAAILSIEEDVISWEKSESLKK